jgi:hypothetical protein
MRKKPKTGMVVGAVFASDADSDTTFSQWLIESGGTGDGLFAIDATTGVITVADAAALKDVKKGTVLTLFVSVWDGYQRSESGQVSIEVI